MHQQQQPPQQPSYQRRSTASSSVSSALSSPSRGSSSQHQHQQQDLPPPPAAVGSSSMCASAIHWAATKGDLRTLRRLIEYDGVDPSATDGSSHHCETPLFRAAGANHTQIIEYLVDYARVDVNQRDDSNHTALAWACYFPLNAGSVETLLRKGADPSIATHDGRTPLMIAAYAGYSDLARILLRFDRSKAGDLLEARVGEQNEAHRRCTPLLLAAEAKRWETVNALLDEGADPTAEDARGRTALSLAKVGGGPRRLVHKMETLIGDAARAELLHKARTLNEAAQAMTRAVLQTYRMPSAQAAPQPRFPMGAMGGGRAGPHLFAKAQAQGQAQAPNPFSSFQERHSRCLAAAPSFLQARVARGESIPVPAPVPGIERPWDGVLLEERAKAVAAYAIAPAVVGEDGQEVVGGGGGGGMPQRAYQQLMALLVPRFLERRDDVVLRAARRKAAQGHWKRARAMATATRVARGLSAASGGGGEAAATVAAEDDGVEESKGNGSGSGRERRESADVKQAQQQQQQQWQQQMAAATPLPGGMRGSLKGMEEVVVEASAAAGGILKKAAAGATANGGGSGIGRLVRQLKAQSLGGGSSSSKVQQAATQAQGQARRAFNL